MSIAVEFTKVKEAFSKVRYDLVSLSKQMGDNYENFLREHETLTNKVLEVRSELLEKIEELKNVHLVSDISNSEIETIKASIKELKAEVASTHKEHDRAIKLVDELRKDKKDIKDLKEKFQSSELELFLLKEKLVEKDMEIKQIKEVSKHLFEIVDELSKIELDLINKSK